MTNNVTIDGRLTADPELRQTPGGANVTSVVLAVDRDRKNADGTRDSDFIPVTAWGKNAEFLAGNFGKGDWIAITGRIRTSTRDREDGTRERRMEVVAEKLNFVGYRKPKE